MCPVHPFYSVRDVNSILTPLYKYIYSFSVKAFRARYKKSCRINAHQHKVLSPFFWYPLLFLLFRPKSSIAFQKQTSCRGEERGLSRKHIIESVQASLKRLQLDYIDVVIIHKADSMCPMEGNFGVELTWVLLNFISKYSRRGCAGDELRY